MQFVRQLSIGERLTITVYLEAINQEAAIRRQLAEYADIMPDEVRQALVVRLGDAQSRANEIRQSIERLNLGAIVDQIINNR